MFTKIVILIIVISSLEARNHPNRRFCKDEYPYKECQRYKIMGFCKTHAKQLYSICPVTCDLCDYGATKKKVCVDKDGPFNCQFLKKNGVCYTHENLMVDRCAKTCNLCDSSKICDTLKCPSCQDCVVDKQTKKPRCECPRYCPYKDSYKSLGKVCASNGKTYKDFCHMQHHSCREQSNLTVAFYGTCKWEECEDSQAEKESGLCNEWKKRGMCSFQQRVMKKYCKKTCGMCRPIKKVPFYQNSCHSSPYGCCWNWVNKPKSGQCKECKDNYPNLCASFMGNCNSGIYQNREFMRTNCPESCGYCMPLKRRVTKIRIFSGSGKRFYVTHLKHKN